MRCCIRLRHYLDVAVITDRLAVLIESPASHKAEREEAAALVADLARDLARLIDLAVTAVDVPAVTARLKETQTRRNEAAARLEHLDGLTRGRGCGSANTPLPPASSLTGLAER